MNSITTTQHPTAGVETVGELLDRMGPSPLTLLSVWAHPDDESLLAGGVLAEVARRGGRVVTLTATAGEHGTSDPIVNPPAVLGRRRIAELDAALNALGGGRAIHLGYEDGTCDRIDERFAAGQVGRIIDEVDPDVIVSFGPDGVTGHPDHCAVSRWVRRAVADRGDRTPLLTTAAADAWQSASIDRLHTIGAFWPGFPVAVDSPDGVTVRLDGEQLSRKLAALACHDSQMPPVAAALGLDHLLSVAGAECYVAANDAARNHMSQELVPLIA